MRDFFVLAIEDRLDAEKKRPNPRCGWRAVFGKAPKGAAAAVQAGLDQEFETIKPDDWK